MFKEQLACFEHTTKIAAGYCLVFNSSQALLYLLDLTVTWIENQTHEKSYSLFSFLDNDNAAGLRQRNATHDRSKG